MSRPGGKKYINQAPPVLEFEGAGVSLDQTRMLIGEPYLLRLEGEPIIAIKRREGHVDFYYLPNEERLP